MMRYADDGNISADDTIREAFSKFASASDSTCVIGLAPGASPSRDLVPAIVEGLQSSANVKRLGLVHESLLLGFLTASIVLQVPGVEVRAFRDFNELEQAWSDA